MCESIGGGGAELEFRSDSDRHGELWQKNKQKGENQSRRQRGSLMLFEVGIFSYSQETRIKLAEDC